jgi:hypothetical protein
MLATLGSQPDSRAIAAGWATLETAHKNKHTNYLINFKEQSHS